MWRAEHAGIPSLVGTRGALPHVIAGDFAEGGGGRVLPIPGWLTEKTTRLPTELEVEPCYDAVTSLWDDAQLYRTMSARSPRSVTPRVCPANGTWITSPP